MIPEKPKQTICLMLYNHPVNENYTFNPVLQLSPEFYDVKTRNKILLEELVV
jgi:hypothetical protein